MNLYLAQQLCPARHCTVAMAYDADTHTPELVDAAILSEVERLGIRPVCALCGSRELRIEHGRLALQDWDAAIRQLRAAEREHARFRAALFGPHSTN